MTSFLNSSSSVRNNNSKRIYIMKTVWIYEKIKIWLQILRYNNGSCYGDENSIWIVAIVGNLYLPWYIYISFVSWNTLLKIKTNKQKFKIYHEIIFLNATGKCYLLHYYMSFKSENSFQILYLVFHEICTQS